MKGFTRAPLVDFRSHDSIAHGDLLTSLLPSDYTDSQHHELLIDRLQLNKRWTRFLSVTVPLATRLVRDYTGGRLLKNEGELARDFRIVVEKLGPTFIKV